MENGADKIRINPGNIGKKRKNQGGSGYGKRKEYPYPRRSKQAGRWKKELVENIMVSQQKAWWKARWISENHRGFGL